MQVEVVSAERNMYSGQAELITAPALEGEVGIMPGHSQMLCILQPGLIRVKVPGELDEQTIYVSGGILEVQPDVVTVLSDSAERARDLDESRALAAKREAEEALAERREEMDMARAQAELAQALAQLRIIQQMRSKLKR